MSQNGTCTHIKVTGVRCGSPALKGEDFCYFHQNAHRGVRRPKQSRLHPIALIEDEESIQYALMEVINALMRNTIDLKRATLILRALHIAVKNASRVKYHLSAKDMVTQIPGYEMPTEEHEALAQEADLPAVAANPNLDNGPEGPHYWERRSEAARRADREDILRFQAEAQAREEGRKRFAQEMAAEKKARAEMAQAATVASAIQANAKPTTNAGIATPANDHVGTAALGSPAIPSEARRSASVRADAACPEPSRSIRHATTSESGRVPSAEATTKTNTPTTVAHDFKKPSQPTNPPIPAVSQTREASATPRKPPTSATPAPKERKNAAHRASGG